jgi:hypothetical protein
MGEKWYWGKVSVGSDFYYITNAKSKPIVFCTVSKEAAKAIAKAHNDAIAKTASLMIEEN